MNHRKNYRKLNRTSSHRKIMFQNMCVSLIISEKESIITTTPKAKELRLYLEPLITKAKNCNDTNKVATVRYLLKKLAGNKDAVTQLIAISDRYKERSGGYMRVIKYGFRHGDSAELSYVALVN